MTDTQRAHGGPLHRLPDKLALAMHIAEPHVKADGSTQRVVSPRLNIRQRWTRQELENTHAEMHEGATK